MFCSRCGTEVADQSKFCPSCGLDLSTTTPLAATPGEKSEVNEIDVVRDSLKDEYEIIKELGRGGMAIVFQAREKHLDRDVAIKVLPFSLAFDKEFVERFQREARTSAKLEHPSIIPIYRVGKTGRTIYFVMKYLRGNSLSEMLESRGPLDPSDIRSFLAQTARALGYAHKHGIVHRDIKPDNIMFDEMGHAVLTDFGIAKAATGTRLTGTGMSIGTPHYMSPEQARAQTLDGRSDIYSLGIVAYQCLTGHVPFDGEDAFSIGYKHIMEELPVPSLQTAEQRLLFEIVQQMMAKDPDVRFQSADDLVAALEGGPVAAGPARPRAPSVADLPTTIMPSPARGSVAIPPDARPTTPTTPIPKAEPPSPPEKREKRRSGVLVGMLVMFLLGSGGAGGYWYFMMDAQWPPQFGARPTASVPESLLTQPAESLVTDSLADTTTMDSTIAPPVELPTTGILVITGRPRLARLTVNGDPQNGDTITVAPGSHRIEVRMSGYETFTKPVPVARGDTVSVAVRLRRIAPPKPKSQCTEPGSDYNRDKSCFSVAPSPTQACVLARPAGAPSPLSALVWVKVKSDGSVETIRRQRESPNREFNIAVLRFVRDLTYRPAQRGGQPVDGWVRLACRSR